MNFSMYNLIQKLFPICRSITGPGIKKSFDIIQKIVPEFKRIKFKSGTKVYDWKIPYEWIIKDAFVLNESNKKIIDFKKNNLHVLNFSIPIDKVISKTELENHLYTLPNQPNLIPYVTSYYKKNWGFCLSENSRKKIKGSKFKVKIDSQFKKGFLELIELKLKGKKKKEIFFSSYLCHPSMANNELSGPSLIVKIAKYLLSKKNTKFSYRLVLLPETIGSISYISRYKNDLRKNVFCGYNLSCVGDGKAYSHIYNINEGCFSDLVLSSALIGKTNLKRYSFLERGSDERQYCSPGVDLPLSGFCRSKYGEFKEYHTSADNLNLVSEKYLQESFLVFKSIIDSFEDYFIPISTTKCEPNLGKRNLYSTISQKKNYRKSNTVLDILAYSNGKRNIFEISQKLNKPLDVLISSCELLKKEKLIKFKN